MTRLRCLWCN